MGETIIWDDYNEMCHKVVEGLAADDIKQLKFSLRRLMTTKELEKINDGQDLIIGLEKRNYLSEKNVYLLYNLLENTCGKVAKVVKTYESHRKECLKSYNQDKYDISSMQITENFVKTHAVVEISKFVTQKGAALIKGTNGAGKSQASYWFANEFYRDHKKSVIWKLNCKSLQDISISLATLLTKLDILKDQETSQNDLAFSVQRMFEVVLKALTSGTHKEEMHLIIMDDIFSPTDNTICELLERFILAKNIYLMATANGPFMSEMTSKFVIEISGMEENEAIQLLKLTFDDENELRRLAKMLNYLPLAISVASSFIKTTKISIDEYLKNLSVFQNQAHRSHKKGQHLQASYEMALVHVEKSLSKYSKQLLSYIPYLSYTNISINVLKSLLPEDTPNEETEITNFISALQSYSLASVTRIGKERYLHMHGLLILALRDKKTETEECEDIIWLLKHYCQQMSIDLRLVETMHRNMAFLDHACLLINNFSSVKEGDIKDILLYKCYLSLCIALTFRIYGRTEISAVGYFEMGQKLIFRLADVCNFECTFESDVFQWILSDTKRDNSRSSVILVTKTTSLKTANGMESFLKGGESLIKDANAIFQLLLKASCYVSLDSLEVLVMKKVRTKREVDLLIRACGKNEINENFVPSSMISDLMSQGELMSLDSLQQTFLVEIFILLLYNSSANKWWIEEANALYTFSDGRHLSVSHESLAEYQLCYNLGNLLETHYQRKHPPHRPCLPMLIRRSGIIYFLRNDIIEPTVSDITGAIELLNSLFEKHVERSERYILLGVINMGSDMDIHHVCTILELMRECYVKLSSIDATNKNYYITQALAKTSILESYIEDLEQWSLLPRVHLAIADMSIMINTPAMARKARKHFRLAITNENQNDDMTRFRLKSHKRYIDFCMKHGEEQDLDDIESLCHKMASRYKDTSLQSYFQSQFECVQQHKMIMKRKNENLSQRSFDQGKTTTTEDLEADAVPDYTSQGSDHEETPFIFSRRGLNNEYRFERMIENLLETEAERLTVEREKLAEAKTTNKTLQELVSNFRKLESCVFGFVTLLFSLLIYLYYSHGVPV